MIAMCAVLLGSSPRGRGKLLCQSLECSAEGLIPAWAGKTLELAARVGQGQAHPRVGGENGPGIPSISRPPGSSPRGRGKPCCPLPGSTWAGLIPAWAGKTCRFHRQAMHARAHPRVGGENLRTKDRPANHRGSSPRGRGKRRKNQFSLPSPGLIPAWAGKTTGRLVRRLGGQAHPRVGGENSFADGFDGSSVGSSPRGRGKHFLTCAFIERIGQILETLELAVSSESYTLSAAYATDAPQDQARNTALVLPSSRAAS